MFFSLIFAAHLPAGGLLESQVLPPGWLLWNQLSGADGRMRKQQLLEIFLRGYGAFSGTGERFWMLGSERFFSGRGREIFLRALLSLRGEPDERSWRRQRKPGGAFVWVFWGGRILERK